MDGFFIYLDEEDFSSLLVDYSFLWCFFSRHFVSNRVKGSQTGHLPVGRSLDQSTCQSLFEEYSEPWGTPDRCSAFTNYFIILFVSFFCQLASVRFLSGLHLCCLFWIKLSFLPSPSAHCPFTFSCVVLFYHLFLALLDLTEVMLSFCLSSVFSCLVNTTYIIMFLVVFARKVLNEFWRCRASSCLQSINLWRSSSSNLIIYWWKTER